MYDIFEKVTDREYKSFIKEKQERYKKRLEKIKKNLYD